MQTIVKSVSAFFLAILMAFMLVPGAGALTPSLAYADAEDEAYWSAVQIGPTLSSTEDPSQENSYRYQNGERIYSEGGATTEEPAGLSLFSIVTPPGTKYTVFNWFDRFPNGYYTGTDAYKGIDVSYHNGVIDWARVKAAGVDYAIIRCGWGMNERGQDDEQWLNNVRNAQKAGMPFGVYIYSYATNTTRAASEADHVLRCLQEAGLNPSNLAYPVYFDMEDKSTENSDLAAIAQTFCNKIEAAGYPVGIYANKYWFTSKLTHSCFNKWTKWVAEWNTNSGLTYGPLSNFTSGNGMWQFSDYGTVPGINSKAVDLDYTFMTPKYNVSFASTSVKGMVRNATGGPIEPDVTVSIKGRILTKGSEYAITYQKAGGSVTTNPPSEPGEYDVSITGAGSYSGGKYLGKMTIYPSASFNGSIPYLVTSSANGSLVLDAAYQTPRQGSNVSIWSSNGGLNQQWYIVPDGNGCFVVKNVANSNLVLDASGSWPNNGANISTWTNNNGWNQKWAIVQTDNGYMFINAANRDLALDATGANPRSGANVTAWVNNGGNNQKWNLVAMNDVAQAQVGASGMVRNTTGSALSPDISVVLSGRTLNRGSDYKVLYNGSEAVPVAAGNYSVTIQGIGGYTGSKAVGTLSIITAPETSSNAAYQLRSVSNEAFILDAANRVPHQGSNVTIWDNNGGTNQMWQFVPDGNGYYVIKNAANTNLVLDAANKTPRQGSNVSVWTNNNGLNQRWILDGSTGSCVIRNAANPDLVLDASGRTPRIGANVTAWGDNGGLNQKWMLAAV